MCIYIYIYIYNIYMCIYIYINAVLLVRVVISFSSIIKYLLRLNIRFHCKTCWIMFTYKFLIFFLIVTYI